MEWNVNYSSAATNPASATAFSMAIPPSTRRLKALARPTMSEPYSALESHCEPWHSQLIGKLGRDDPAQRRDVAVHPTAQGFRALASAVRACDQERTRHCAGFHDPLARF